MRVEEILKYLGGGVIVYLAMAACSGNDAVSSGGTGGIAGQDAMGGHDAVGDSASDHNGGYIDSLIEPVPDAHAQDGSGCGTCTVSGTVRVVTADTDPSQIVGGSVLVASTPMKVADGPFVLTDARPANGFWVDLWISVGGMCGEADAERERVGRLYEIQTESRTGGTTVAIGGTRFQALHGARILIPSGSALCALSSSTSDSQRLRWSGFRAY
jgi:hypothetical protein